MQLSGREIQTLWPAGMGWPSVGAGRSFPLTSTTAGAAGSCFAAGERKYDSLSCCHTVSSTPEAYAPGCLRTASIPALRSTERSEEHTSELQSHHDIVCRLLLE